ncbi:MAG: amidohydrolase family protein [Vicinamibacterales bacterium]
MSVAALAATCALLAACGPSGPPPAPLDLLVTNARIVDGTGGPARDGAVAIAGGRVAEVLDAAAAASAAGRAARVIDAKGRVVAPGFIDMHSHSDMPLVTDGHAQSKIRQGVTTEVIGESGSIAPRKTPGDRQPWTDFAGYFAVLEKQGISVNLLSHVGLGTVRELVVGNDDRPPTAEELSAMQDLVTASMREGAIGVSTGLIYPPNAFASLDELIALSRPAAALGGRYASHLRNDGKKLREGIEEAIAIGEGAKIPVHVFHIKVTGKANFGRMQEVVDLVDQAHARGVTLTADVYPYVASSTSLTATLPQWVLDGGPDKMVERLRDRRTRQRVRRDMEDPNAAWDNRYQSAGTWANVQLASIGRTGDAAADAANRKYEGMRVAEAAKAAGADPFDFVFDLLASTRGTVGCVYFIMSEDDVRLALKQPWVAIGSDGSALSIEGPLRSGVPHPRNFGTFPRVLAKYVRDEGVLTLEEAVRKMTSLPASSLKLADRGTVAPGQWADLVIFDPATVADTATFEQPFAYPVGIDTVIVNGQVVLDEGTHTGTRPGRVLRRQ